MAQPNVQPNQFVNVIALAIIILPFLATAALERIDEWGDEGLEAYFKIGSLFALFLGFIITVLVAWLVLRLAGQAFGGLQMTAAYLLFVALYLPTLAILIRPMVEATELMFSPELNQWKVVGVLAVVGIATGFLINANPVT